MRDFTRRTLRTWSVLDLIYGAAVIGTAAVLIPWKTSWINGALIAFGAAHAVAGHGLWRGRRWGWRLAVGLSGLGASTGLIVVGGLLFSWAYLASIYGDFGRGAAIGSLLFASAAAQVLGLFPALQLRAMLRREVRSDFDGGWAAVAVSAMAIALPPVIAAATWVYFSWSPLPPVNEAGREQAVAHLRAGQIGAPRPEIPALIGLPTGPGPLFVTIWRDGEIAVRVRGNGADLAAAVADAADHLARAASGDGGTLKIDRVVAAGPVLSDAVPIVALSVNPGLDGLWRAGGERALLPDDLVQAEAFGAAPLVPGIREIRLGLDARYVLDKLGLPDAPLGRFRTESWVDTAGGVRSVVRGNTPGPEPSSEAFRAAAVAGGDYILRQIRDDNRFHYRYSPIRDQHPDDRNYSIPRHAGTVYSLSLLYGATEADRFRVGARRAMSWLVEQMPPRCGVPERTCVPKGRSADLGSAALTLVAMMEYQRQTKDTRYVETAKRLAEFVLWLQREDGDFHHVVRLSADEAAIDPVPRRMFYSEEAALALTLLHGVLGDPRYLDAARRALDFLTGPKYDFFLGRFIYGADHWTCIAAEEAWPRLESRQYLDFCLGYARFMSRIQFEPDCWENADFTGHYGFTALMVPQAPAAAGFSEAMVSTYALSAHHGAADERVRGQAHLALAALTRDQLRDDNAWLVKSPARARGGIRRSLVEPDIRIDFAQHAVSALIRGAAL